MTAENDDSAAIDALDAAVDALFKGALAVSTPRAFKALGIGVNKGHDLLNSGALKSVKLGRARRVYVSSIKQLLRDGLPPKPVDNLAGASIAAGARFKRPA
jgi:hypothetical protein